MIFMLRVAFSSTHNTIIVLLASLLKDPTQFQHFFFSHRNFINKLNFSRWLQIGYMGILDLPELKNLGCAPLLVSTA